MNLLSTEKQKDVMKHIASFFFFDSLKNIRSRSGRIRQGSSIVAAHDVIWKLSRSYGNIHQTFILTHKSLWCRGSYLNNSLPYTFQPTLMARYLLCPTPSSLHSYPLLFPPTSYTRGSQVFRAASHFYWNFALNYVLATNLFYSKFSYSYFGLLESSAGHFQCTSQAKNGLWAATSEPRPYT